MRTRPPAASSANSSAKWDAGIQSIVDLAAVSTVGLATTPPTIRAWINAEDGSEQLWRLIASTASNDPDNGVLRPSDYSSSNLKVWFRAQS